MTKGIKQALTHCLVVAAGVACLSALALGIDRPLLEGGEVSGVGVARGAHGHAEVFSSPTGILSASVERDNTAEGDLRRNKIVVGSKGCACIAGGSGGIVRAVMTLVRILSRVTGPNTPCVSVAIGIDGCPGAKGAILEVTV